MEICFTTNEKSEVSSMLEIKRSYVDPNFFFDELNRRVYPLKGQISQELLPKPYKVFSSKIDEKDLVNYLSNFALETPIIRVKIYEKDEHTTLMVYKFPPLTDLQMDYINELFTLLVEKVLDEEDVQFGTLEFYFKYNVITELGLEIHDHGVYLTAKVYNPENESLEFFKELHLKELVLVDEEVNSEDEEQLNMDENDNRVLEFDFKITQIK